MHLIVTIMSIKFDDKFNINFDADLITPISWYDIDMIWHDDSLTLVH